MQSFDTLEQAIDWAEHEATAYADYDVRPEWVVALRNGRYVAMPYYYAAANEPLYHCTD